MHRDGHIGVNALVFAPVATHLAAERRLVLLVVGAVVVVGCASLPDVDHRLPVRHRGVTHTVWFAGLVGGAVAGGLWAAGIPAQSTGTALWGFAFGALAVLGHLLGDALTPWGVEPLAPVSDSTVSLGLVTAGNALANRGLLLVGSCLLVGSLVGAAGAGPAVPPLPRGP